MASPSSVLRILGPGLLVAATGVGAGDLATAAFTGNRLGVTVLWAVLAGAGLKLLLTEGLARWQLATGTTLLEGGVRHLGRPFQVFFLVYLVFWSYFVGAALMSACGAAAWALLPLSDPRSGKILYGLLHSAAGIGLVYLGGYRLFEKVMGVCIGLMFVTVVGTAFLLEPDWSAVLGGLLPSIPGAGEGLSWTIALMGGVGGTLTILCYGYWIREEGRTEPEELRTCRLDLAAGYAMTALFGVAMVIIGASTAIEGSGVSLLVDLGGRLDASLGAAGKWVFLVGAWGAVFSSLLGVWQSVPYLFADSWRLLRGGPGAGGRVDTRSAPYLGYLLALGTIPAAGLWEDFREVQKLYAIVGAAFMPVLALTLLWLNGSARRVGAELQNRPATTLLLVAALLFFAWAGWLGSS